MQIALINYAYDADLADAEALLARYASLTGWAESLLAAGAERVTVLQRFGRDAELERGGVRYLLRADGAGPQPARWQACWRLAREAARLRPDLAHVHGLQFPLQIWALRRCLGSAVALLAQDHGGWPGATHRSRALVRRPVYQAGLGAADGLLFTSAELAQPWRTAGLIRAEMPIYSVPEASRAIERIPAEQARAFSGVAGDPAVVWVGHLDANKDPLTALEGFARALAHLPGARLTMIFGKASLLPAVRERLARSGALAERVLLRGQVPHAQIASYLGAADVFLLASRRESCGFALIEALLSGAAPAVTDIPAFRALAGGAPHARLWTAGDPAALADALVAASQGRGEARRAEIAAYAERCVSWRAVGRRALEVYRLAVSGRRAILLAAKEVG